MSLASYLHHPSLQSSSRLDLREVKERRHLQGFLHASRAGANLDLLIRWWDFFLGRPPVVSAAGWRPRMAREASEEL